MNFWVCTAGTHRATGILGRVHAAFFNYHHFNVMTNMPDEIILAKIMTALDLEFEGHCTTMMRDMTVTMIIDYQVQL